MTLFNMPLNTASQLGITATCTVEARETPIPGTLAARIQANADYVKFIAGQEGWETCQTAVQTPGVIALTPG